MGPIHCVATNGQGVPGRGLSATPTVMLRRKIQPTAYPQVCALALARDRERSKHSPSRANGYGVGVANAGFLGSGGRLLPDVERELLKKCQGGDARFFEPIVRAYERPGMRVALGMMGNQDDARDALQDAFVKAWQSLARFDLKRPFSPWFFQILRNQCRDALRSRQARFRLEALDERLELKPADPEAGPERRRERTAAKELLWKALERLGEDHREILVLKELEGFRYGEIAGILEIPEGTVASRLFHARRALADVLEQLGVKKL